ncbi:MAG TPA: anaerobic ribonucleoside-triphosphate reductase activating protein [Candidatus Omnitrophota bacterium]|nr:anaerobic ribonucleoside-triphosphate reductase activating protein [Candidatus Omnitrophota bacterium]HPS36890.1 anaerobic ribonucleoside-triphosphate reductase activating protein [Candidatus Omnitrophota bacterium]
MSGSISKNPPGAAASPNKDAATGLKTICVAGITPFTTIDFPGRLAGVFYLQGCLWRCRYCYNSEFWPMPSSQGGPLVPLEKILHFLDSRKGHLDGIVFSGGEPTVHPELGMWMKTVRDRGYEVGLHTNGMFPDRLASVLPLCRWVGMDIKAPFAKYEKVTGVKASGEAPRKSAEALIASGVPYEFRTTVHPVILPENEILESAIELAAMGAKNYVLQAFRGEHCPDKELRDVVVQGSGISANLRQTLKGMFPSFQVRE